MSKQLAKSRTAMAVGSALAAFAAGEAVVAQEAQLEEVTVTGSRIQRDVGFTSPVPVTAVEADELSMFEPGLGVSEQLETLPQYFGNVSSDNVAGRVPADVGQSQLNMRGMGGERTLVLLDGSRVVPSDRRSSVSVDYLPSPLIRRVEVVTGGASAAYGADAVAGVTNFILDRQFTGLEFDVRTGMNEFGDGEYTRGSVTWGDDIGDGGRLHLFGSLEARVNDGYRRGTRDDPYGAEWDKDEGYVRNPEWFPGAPAGIPQRLTKQYVYDTEFSPTGLIRQPGFSLDRYQFTEDGTGVMPFQEADFVSLPFEPGTQQSQAGQPGDYQYDLWKRTHPQTFERVGVELQTAFLGADFQLTDRTTLWGHALYGRTANYTEGSTAGGAGTFLGHAGLATITAFQENPFLPDEVSQAMEDEGLDRIRIDQHGYMNSDWGFSETNEIIHEMTSVTGGFDTDLGGDWSLRGSYQYGEAEKRNHNQNWERLDRFYFATDAIEDPDNPGEIICRIQLVARQFEEQGRDLEAELHAWAQENSQVFPTYSLELDPSVPIPVEYPFAVDSVDNTISDCVPVNMFGTGNQSQEAIDYIFNNGPDKRGLSVQEQHFAELLANGVLHEGWGPGPVTAAFGATYREESIKQTITPREINELGPMYNVTLDDGTVVSRGIAPFIHGSATNLHRFSDQPTFAGGFDVWEAFAETIVPLFATDGGQSAEVNLAARYADYSRAGENVVWKAGLNFQLTDGLRFRGTYSHDIREGSFEELFVQQGRGANVEDPWNNNESYTTFNLTGGNPDLEPEEADTAVLGFVWQPSFAPDLQFSVDRYEVDLSSAIGTFAEQEIVDQCFETGALCERVERSPTTGRITRVKTLFVNIDAAKVSGYDLEVAYRTEPDFFSNRSESLFVRLFGGYMDENSSTPLGGNTVDDAGEANLPKTTATALVGYNVGNLSINLQQSYRGTSKRNNSWVAGVDVDDNSVPSVNLTNLGVSWSATTDTGNGWRASLNVNNLFDRDPVIAGTTMVGDLLGRRYSLGFEYNMQ